MGSAAAIAMVKQLAPIIADAMAPEVAKPHSAAAQMPPPDSFRVGLCARERRALCWSDSIEGMVVNLYQCEIENKACGEQNLESRARDARWARTLTLRQAQGRLFNPLP